MKINFLVAGLTLILSLLGLINFLSASYFLSLKTFGDPYFIFFRFLIKITFAGLVVFFIGYFLAKKPIRYKTIFLILFFLLYLSIFLGFLPQFQLPETTAARWVNLGFFSFQPSEIIKPLAILVFAFLCSALKNFSLMQKTMLFILCSLVLLLPIYLQPSLSNVMIILASIVVVFVNFLKSTKEIISSAMIVMVLALILVVVGSVWSYRKERFMSFLTKGKVFEEKYFQVEQSILAISSGGSWGKGLGKSEIKIIGLPQMLTDSIFAVYAEENGFKGSIIFLALFFLLILTIIKLGLKTEDQIRRSFALAVAVWLSLQTFLHIASNTGLFVPTGVILPFFSYGASGQLAIYFSLGFIARNG